MQGLIWAATGIASGWLARRFMRHRGYGLAGDLILGTIGSFAGGWLFRAFGFGAVAGPLQQGVVSTLGAMLVLGVSRMVRPVARQTSRLLTDNPANLDLEAQIRRLGRLESRALARLLGHRPVRDPNAVFDEQLTFGQRAADRVARFGGSWTFIGIFVLLMIVWMSINTEVRLRFDPYPFILLNLVLSCLAALQAPIIMMSQNRLSVKDRMDAQHDYEVNLRAELQIQHLHAKLDEYRGQDWGEMMALQRRQIELLERLAARFEAGPQAG
jgi:uncharacterized membrane protein/uncharacterized membrane protein YeaQ/YmgE (transglycosylase-associated protein family)